MLNRPIIGIFCDVKDIGLFPFHAVGDKYVRAVQQAVGDVVLLPAQADTNSLMRVIESVDGLFLPGSLSNVEPRHYGGTPSRNGTLHDQHRDATTLPLIPEVVKKGVPLFGICRGFQEMNVAFGGELYQHVQEEEGMLDHREPEVGDVPTLYKDTHEVALLDGSYLSSLLGVNKIMVNSLHQQGVKRLADGLVAEAIAPDHLIEAFRVKDAATFAYGVQWHPEWLFNEKPASIALFKAFREACEARMNNRKAHN